MSSYMEFENVKSIPVRDPSLLTSDLNDNDVSEFVYLRFKEYPSWFLVISIHGKLNDATTAARENIDVSKLLEVCLFRVWIVRIATCNNLITSQVVESIPVSPCDISSTNYTGKHWSLINNNVLNQLIGYGNRMAASASIVSQIQSIGLKYHLVKSEKSRTNIICVNNSWFDLKMAKWTGESVIEKTLDIAPELVFDIFRKESNQTAEIILNGIDNISFDNTLGFGNDYFHVDENNGVFQISVKFRIRLDDFSLDSDQCIIKLT